MWTRSQVWLSHLKQGARNLQMCKIGVDLQVINVFIFRKVAQKLSLYDCFFNLMRCRLYNQTIG